MNSLHDFWMKAVIACNRVRMCMHIEKYLVELFTHCTCSCSTTVFALCGILMPIFCFYSKASVFLILFFMVITRFFFFFVSYSRLLTLLLESILIAILLCFVSKVCYF